MIRLRDWLVAGAVVPAALVALPGLVVAVAAGADGFVTTLGAILLYLVLVVPPGALVGLLLGVMVLAIARRLPPRGMPTRANRLRLAAAAVFVISVGASAAVLRFTASDGIGWQAYWATSAGFAVIPTILAVVAWRRWTPPPAPVPAGPDDEGHSAAS